MSYPLYIQAAALFAAGIGPAQVARDLGITRSMAKWLKKNTHRVHEIKARAGSVESTNQCKRWTPSDDRRLSLLWEDEDIGGLASIAKTLGRTKATTYWRARKLGLHCGVPQGLETLAAAAKRTGYAPKTLLRIIVHCHRHRGTPTRSHDGNARFRLHDPLSVDDAVAAWLTRAPLEQHARERGVVCEVIRKALIRNGAKPPKQRKATWRVSNAYVAAAMRRRASEMSIAGHARRLGVDRLRLAEDLRGAGLLKAKRPGGATLLTIADVDAALEHGRAA